MIDLSAEVTLSPDSFSTGFTEDFGFGLENNYICTEIGSS